MKIYYLDNSGFALMTGGTLLVFDYWRLPEKGGSFDNGFVDESRLCDFDRVYFFVSHKHSDHFNKGIYALDGNPNTKYICSYGVPKNERREIRFPLKEGDAFEDDCVRVYAGGSTDLGVSFIVDIDGKRIFHAGDLNCWHWQGDWSKAEEEHSRHIFTKALIRLGPHARNIDLAFFPVDPRMKGGYDDGAKEFIARFTPRYFVPMHCAGDCEMPRKFKAENEGGKTKIIAYHKRGEMMELEL